MTTLLELYAWRRSRLVKRVPMDSLRFIATRFEYAALVDDAVAKLHIKQADADGCKASGRFRIYGVNVMEIEARVRSVIVEHLGVEPEEVVLSARILNDLGADSLDAVDLTMALEEAFDIEIPDLDGEKLRTVQDVVDYCAKATATS